MNFLRIVWNVAAVVSLIAFVACSSEPSVDSTTEEAGSDASILDQITKLEGEVTFTLEDAEELNREFSDTFWIPSKERRENLMKDDLVKLVFQLSDGRQAQAERMWVLVTSGDSSGYVGVLDNDPYSTDQIQAGFEVSFEPRHVIDIYEVEIPEDDQAEGTGG